MKNIKIIGAGLAGSEAALQLADRGWQVKLYEMRPAKMTPAHESGLCAELVCSNSLKSFLPTTSSGMLKSELELLGCRLLEIAAENSVAAGYALAVNRNSFATAVTAEISRHPNIELIREEVSYLDDELTIIATGPLTSEKLTEALLSVIGHHHLYFFDAIAPIISAESLDYSKVFSASRYTEENADYLNCPFTREEYYRFVTALQEAEKHEAKEFESCFFEQIDLKFYENCTPIEELARRGEDTLRFGVMRPVGIETADGSRPFALLQLRSENRDRTSFNLVGCQTMLKYGVQKAVFQLIPGLEQAEFLRFGSIHRNTYLNSPEILNENLSLKAKPNIFIAGQLSGVEGYAESIYSGLLVSGIVSQKLTMLPETTISGMLWRHLITPAKNFQPMNANFGRLPELVKKIRDKKLKKQLYFERGIEDLKKYLGENCAWN